MDETIALTKEYGNYALTACWLAAMSLPVVGGMGQQVRGLLESNRSASWILRSLRWKQLAMATSQ